MTKSMGDTSSSPHQEKKILTQVYPALPHEVNDRMRL